MLANNLLNFVIRTGFHTQEKRAQQLTSAILCVKDNAWLGEAYYFWIDENDAIYWGIKSKRRSGYYEIYEARIDCSNVLDTVFNEDHYRFWIKQIEKVAQNFITKARIKPTLKEINDYFREKGIWSNLDGIMFQDISNNSDHFFVKEFQYKKRIQIAVYNYAIVSNFAFRFEGQCV